MSNSWGGAAFGLPWLWHNKWYWFKAKKTLHLTTQIKKRKKQKLHPAFLESLCCICGLIGIFVFYLKLWEQICKILLLQLQFRKRPSSDSYSRLFYFCFQCISFSHWQLICCLMYHSPWQVPLQTRKFIYIVFLHLFDFCLLLWSI